MNFRNRYYITIAVVCLSTLLLGSCVGGSQHAQREGAVTRLPLDHAKNLRLYSHPDGWVEAEIINPWDTTSLLQRIAIVPDSIGVLPSSVPDGATVVWSPLKRSLVTTSMHLNLISELGAETAVAGVTDADYIHLDYVRSGLDDGTILDCGVTTAPTIERVISLTSDGILLSPYERGGDYGKLTKLSVPILYTADYMEPDPLGRAEWMKYYALLFGKEAVADSLFAAVEKSFTEIKNRAEKTLQEDSVRPKVLFDLPYQGVWYVSGGNSMNNTYISLAGGENPFSSIDKKTVPMAPERVIVDGGDADVWLVRYNDFTDLTREQMQHDNPVVSQFKAFRDGNVYVANTGQIRYFEESPFHPEYLLGDIAEILHPTGSHPLRYFKKLK